MSEIIRKRLEKYDSLRGQWVRDVKSNDIVSVAVSTASTSIGTGDITLASTITDSDHELLLVSYSISSSIANGVACITLGNSTVLQHHLGTASIVSGVQNIDSPFLRVPASTTVGLHFNCVTAGTVTGYANFVKQPLPEHLEIE